MGGLYSATALRESDQVRVTVYTKHRLKLYSQNAFTNDGGLKNLDTQRDGGRIGKIVLHVGGSAVAPEGVLCPGGGGGGGGEKFTQAKTLRGTPDSLSRGAGTGLWPPPSN